MLSGYSDVLEQVAAFLDLKSLSRFSRVCKATSYVAKDKLESKVTRFEDGKYVNSFCGFYKYMHVWTVERKTARAPTILIGENHPRKRRHRIRVTRDGVEYVKIGLRTILTAKDVYTPEKAAQAEANNSYWRISL